MKFSMKSVKAGSKMAMRMIEKKSPLLLTIGGATGVISTAIMSAKAMPKTLRQIEGKEKQYGRRLSKIEKVKLTWTNFIPAGGMGALSIAAIFASDRINSKRAAALSAAYELTKGTLNEYQKKVIDVIGEKKEEKIREEIKQDRIDAAVRDDDAHVWLTGHDEILCLDSYSGRLYKSDYEYMRHIVNDLNERMFSHDFVSLNEYYYAVGLDGVKNGDEIGWSMSTGLIDIHYTSQLTDKGLPCLYVDYDIGPRHRYGDF